MSRELFEVLPIITHAMKTVTSILIWPRVRNANLKTAQNSGKRAIVAKRNVVGVLLHTYIGKMSRRCGLANNATSV